MKSLYIFICGFSITFSFIVWIMILLFIWPIPLYSFVTGQYPIWDSQLAILGTAAFCGFLVGGVCSVANETLDQVSDEN